MMQSCTRNPRRPGRALYIVAAALFLTACGPPEAPGGEAEPPAARPTVPGAATAPPSAPPTASVAEPGPPSEATRALTPEGWGPIRIGMSRAEVVAAAGEDANPDAVGGPEPDACDQFRPARAPEGMLVMLERNRVTRITVSDDTTIVTERSFGVGDEAAAIEQAYGADAVVSPHKYWPAPAEYVTVWTVPPADGADARGLVYEIGPEGRVAHIHAGGASIQYVEGCL